MCAYLERALENHLVHVALGGSVLHKGESYHDVDVFIYPHDTCTATISSIHQIYQAILNLGFTYNKEEHPSTTDKPVYVMFTPKGRKRVDFFYIGF